MGVKYCFQRFGLAGDSQKSLSPSFGFGPSVIALGLLLSACTPFSDSTTFTTSYDAEAEYSSTNSVISVSSPSIVNGSQTIVTLKAEDQNENLYTSTLTVRFSISSGTAAGYFSTPLNHGNGTYTSNFTATSAGALNITATVNGGTIQSTPAAVTVISNGPKLVFGQQPTSAISTAAISPAITVSVESQSGSLLSTDNSDNITLAIGTNPSSGTLSGTTTVTVTNGVATFSNLSIGAAGAGYTLTASSGTLTGATSSTFNISAGTASQLAFATQPSATEAAGGTLAQSPVLKVVDGQGNTVTSSSASIALALYGDSTCSTTPLATTPSSAASLSGTTTRSASSGQVTFSGLGINDARTTLYLQATSSGLTSACSSLINVSPGAFSTSQSTLSVTSNSVVSASTLTATLTAKDAYGNLNPSGINALPSGVTFSSTTVGGTGSFGTVSGSSGVYTAVFTANHAGAVTLSGAINASTISATQAVTISAGSATALAFTQQPSNTASAQSISPAVQVSVVDSDGNVITSDNTDSITVAIGTNPSSGTLSGTKTVTVTSGVASFSTLNIDKAGTAYTLTAAGGSFTGATSSAFNITAGTAYKLAYNQQPTSAVAESAISPTVTVSVEDQASNVLTSDSTDSITMAIGTNPSSGTLSGTSTVTASNGVASFSALKINLVGTGYTLTASSGSLQTATSSTFNITPGTASQIVFTQQPSNVAAGSSISPAVLLAVEDASGNVVTSDNSDSVTLAIGTNPTGSSHDVLSGTKTITVTNGVASFSTLSLNLIGTGYTLTASSGSFSATSSTFNVTAGTGFTYNWNLNSSYLSDLTFDSSLVECIGGSDPVCRNKQVNQADADDTPSGFGGALSSVGTSWYNAGNVLTLDQSGTPTNTAAFSSDWTPEFASLISAWHLDDASGSSTVVDSVGSNAGTPTNVTLGATGHLAEAGVFDGSTSTINTGTWNITSTGFTISAWVYPTSSTSGSNNVIFSKFDGSSGYRSYDLTMNFAGVGDILFAMSDLGSNYVWMDTAAGAVPANVWSHIVATYNAGTFGVYVNGISQGLTVNSSSGAAPTGAPYSSSTQVRIGSVVSQNGAAHYFQGSIDEVAVWSKALTPSEVDTIYNRQSALYSGTIYSRVMDSTTTSANWSSLSWTPTLPFLKELPDYTSAIQNETSTSYPSLEGDTPAAGDNNLMTGLVGLWHMDEPNGTSGTGSVQDRSGEGNNGTPTNVIFGTNGALGTAGSFNSGCITIPASNALNMAGDSYTISTWINTTYAAQADGLIFEHSVWPSNDVYQLDASTSTSLRFNFPGMNTNEGPLDYNVNYSDGHWHHVVATFSYATGVATIYFDGQYGASKTVSESVSGALSNSYIGCRNNSANYFIGSLDEFSIWQKALNATEVLELYRRGANRIKYQVRTCPDTTCSTNPSWQGPDASNQTYFSEMNNNAVPLDGADLSSSDSVNISLPTMPFASFASPMPSTNRYFQYRAVLESDDTSELCNYGSGQTWCSPELQQVAVGPNHYVTGTPTITATVGQAFYNLSSFAQTLGTNGCAGTASYVLSPDGTNWYYWTGAAWALSNGTSAESNSATVLTPTVLGYFADQVGTGTAYFEAFLPSDGTNPCELSTITLTGS